jgi:branched-chain amino acid transport system substrate-binding protein
MRQPTQWTSRRTPRGRYVRWIVGVMALLIGVGACSSAASSSGGSGSSADPIRLGMVDSLTGADASFGVSNLCGVQVAIASINASGGVLGRKLTVTTADDQSTPSVAAQQSQRLTSEGIRLFVGGSASEEVLSDLPYFKQTDSLFMGGTTKTSDVLDYYPLVVRINSSSAQDMKFVADYLSAHYSGSIVLVGLQGTYTQGEFSDLIGDLSKTRFPTIKSIYAPDTTTDWSTYITAIESLNPSVIVDAPFTGTGQVSLLKQLDAAGLSSKEFAVPGLLVSSTIDQAGIPATQNVVAADNWLPSETNSETNKLRSAYNTYSKSIKACGGESFVAQGKYMAIAYAQVELLADAMTASKSTDPQTIKKTIVGRSWQLPFGQTSFAADGQATQNYFLYKVINGVQKVMN